MIDADLAPILVTGLARIAEAGAVGEPNDLFALGRKAAAMARQAHGGKGVFARSRQLLATGGWRGPRDAADTFVEEADLDALGGLQAARAAGADTLVAGASTMSAKVATEMGLRCLWRLPFRTGEGEDEQLRRIEELAAMLRLGQPIAGVIPTPQGEPPGLETLRMVALCRLRLASTHVVADVALLGHRLAQMTLAFGADELFGPIVAERALRLGHNAHNPALTRKEAALLIRGAGLVACERISGGALEEVAS